MATYYWVGGSGTWNNTNAANWSLSSGGAGGAGVPTITDGVNFDANSGATPTITIASTAKCNWASFGTTGATYSLSGSATFGAAATTDLTAGTLVLNNNTLTVGSFSSSSGTTRSIQFGTGQINITSTTPNINWANSTNFSYTGTFKIVLTGSGTVGTRIIYWGSATPGYWTESTAISIGASVASGISLGSTSTANLALMGVFKDVNYTSVGGSTQSTFMNGNITVYGNLTFSSAHAVDISTNWLYRMAGTTGTQSLNGGGATVGGSIVKLGASTVTLGSALTLSNSNYRFEMSSGTFDLNGLTLTPGRFYVTGATAKTLAFNGGNIVLPYGGTVIWYIPDGTNFTYTGTLNVSSTYTGATGTRYFANGNTTPGYWTEVTALSFGPTGGGTPFTFNTAATDAVCIAGRWNSINLTGYAGSLSSIAGYLSVVYGNLTLGASTNTVVSTNQFTFAKTSGTQTLTSNGRAFNFPLTVSAPGATVSCADALTVNDSNGVTFTAGTLSLASGTTSTVAAFTTTGTTLKYLRSSTPGSQATISDASGTNTATYLSITDSNATGGATWDASAATNVNGGNNTGWVGLPGPAVATGNFFMLLN